jgi:hypothetical protein
MHEQFLSNRLLINDLFFHEKNEVVVRTCEAV